MGKGYTLYNLRIILVLTLGSLTFGYGFSIISSTLGQPGFLSYFDLEGDSSQQNAITGAINGIFCAGAVCGSLMVGWMAEARGRKTTMYVASIINIVGEALEAGSVHIGMFLASRFIAGWGIGSIVVLIPLYQAEICELNVPSELTYSSSRSKRIPSRTARYMGDLRLCSCRMDWCGRLLLAKPIFPMAIPHRSSMPSTAGLVGL
jgi:MFS family permease